jgi:hypothetical protein
VFIPVHSRFTVLASGLSTGAAKKEGHLPLRGPAPDAGLGK